MKQVKPLRPLNTGPTHTIYIFYNHQRRGEGGGSELGNHGREIGSTVADESETYSLEGIEWGGEQRSTREQVSGLETIQLEFI